MAYYLELLAKGAGLKPGRLIAQLGDCHLYNNHLDQAKEYISRTNKALPRIELAEGVRISKKMGARECCYYTRNRRHTVKRLSPTSSY
jgi:thymidylate synthase